MFMKFNETKAILKLAKNTEDEKLKEFLNKHYLADDEEPEKEVKVEDKPKQEPEAEKPKEEPKKEEEKKEPQPNYVTQGDLEKLMKEMSEKFDNLTKDVQKSQPFGSKAKPKEPKEQTEMDKLIEKYNSR